MSRHDDAMRRSAIDRLRKAIRDLHGLESEHVESVQVHDTAQGKTLWEGEVAVFRVAGHPRATHAYAWAYKDGSGTSHYVAVLGVPPINSPLNAVQAAAMEGRKQSGN